MVRCRPLLTDCNYCYFKNEKLRSGQPRWQSERVLQNMLVRRSYQLDKSDGKNRQLSQAWSTSIMTPNCKGKDDTANCSTYRPARPISRALKILEHVFDQTLQEIVDITS